MCKKKVTAWLLAAAVLMCAVPGMPVSAQEEKLETAETETEEKEETVVSVEDANKAIDSYDDAEAEWEEIYIKDTEGFQAFAQNCRLDTWSQDKKVYLTADIDLAGKDFAPIPTFGGYFDGQGHTVSGLTVRDSVSYVGLFNETQRTAVVANLRVEGTVRPSGSQMVVGGIVGDNSGILLNCVFDGVVEASDYVGGIVGYNEISGVLMDCAADGTVKGAHYTGGIAGENVGNIVGCLNRADVNISNEDKSKSLEDFNLDNYTTGFWGSLAGEEGDEKTRKLSTIGNVVDTGGIAGLSTGIIQNCVNEGIVGYEHVGYNTGGIVGRQSGYVYACANKGKIYGRKDVGGIVGQAEPYIAVDLSEDIIKQLSDHIDTLHSQISTMLEDTGNQSDTLSNRLSVIRDFADRALDDTHFLADRTVTWTDSMMDSVSEAANRFDYVLDETAKDGGVIDQASDAAKDTREAADRLEATVKSMNLYQYMTPEEREQYDQAKKAIEEERKKRDEDVDQATAAYENYYIDKARMEDTDNEYDLKPMKESGVDSGWNYDANIRFDDIPSKYIGIIGWVHHSDSGDRDFPLTDGSAQAEADRKVQEKAQQEMSDNSVAVTLMAENYADKQYSDAHNGNEYLDDMRKNLETMTNITSKYSDEMTEDARKHLGEAVSSAKDAVGSLEDMGDGTKDILKTLNDKEDITFPRLGEDYRSATGSLNSNLKNISENMGYLNDEMSSSGDVLEKDLSDINDEFSEIMLLYTDALDGVLDMDYSGVYEDESQEDAEESIDATIADCTNNGIVEADLNVSGIAGTMAIEYDFDLESDITGIDNARVNSTFLTKCVQRQNVNQANIKAQKSYVGGVCGLQEMGTVLRCENYGRIESTAGDYVGGIAGQSLSHIVRSYAKCTVSGGEYVAGIAGYGYGIKNCCAMVKVGEASAFSGAIAGKISDDAEIAENYFVSDEIAGIDRISYSGKAEPADYETILQMEGIPAAFRRMRIVFYADDEEVGIIECPYGGSVALDAYPNIPAKEGFYADWDNKELTDVRLDEDVTVEYVRYLTTLAGDQLRENKQSVLLADGMFAKEDELTVENLGVNEAAAFLGEETSGRTLECWRIEIPDDGQTTHQIRYQAPQGETKGVEIYVEDSSGKHKVETELMGIYHLFPVDGNQVEIAVSVAQNGMENYIVYIAAGGAAALLLIALVVHRKKKRRAKKAAAKAEAEEDKNGKE